MKTENEIKALPLEEKQKLVIELRSVKPGDKGDVQLKITAAKDAPLGEQKIVVKGTPDKGEATEIEFKITVSAK